MKSSETKYGLTLPEILGMLWRSFFIQSVWNFKSMVSVGFCFVLSPIGQKICKNKEEYVAFLKRHLGFFNAHPYFASYAMGAIARLEQQMHNQDTETIERFKNALISPLGAIGDRCCWAVLRPAALIFGLVGMAYYESLELKSLHLLLTFVLYNIPHIHIRLKGIIDGYQSGFDIYKKLKIENFEKLLNFFKIIGIIGLGMLIAWNLREALTRHWLMLLLFGITFTVSLWLKMKRRMFYTPVLISLVLAIVCGVL
ncbi:PTS system mannose/fructose/sorbose family transporter subunit IID [Calditrichota bacterium GD2]